MKKGSFSSPVSEVWQQHQLDSNEDLMGNGESSCEREWLYHQTESQSKERQQVCFYFYYNPLWQPTWGSLINTLILSQGTHSQWTNGLSLCPIC
jgi:hypothetical protein